MGSGESQWESQWGHISIIDKGGEPMGSYLHYRRANGVISPLLTRSVRILTIDY